ncbi:MAG: hypothetical protein ABI208_08695 [Ginsengibacter sp.]
MPGGIIFALVQDTIFNLSADVGVRANNSSSNKETTVQHTDDKINKLGYELYGLEEEEVGIIENNEAN